MKRPTKPRTKKFVDLVLSEYQWSNLTFKELVEKLSSLKIPFEELFFKKSYDYDGNSDMDIYRNSVSESDVADYNKKMEQYKKDLIAYHEYKAKQLKEDMND